MTAGALMGLSLAMAWIGFGIAALFYYRRSANPADYVSPAPERPSTPCSPRNTTSTTCTTASPRRWCTPSRRPATPSTSRSSMGP